jgi:hypothetical protein
MQEERGKTSAKEQSINTKTRVQKGFFSFLLHTLFFFVPRGKREKVSAKEKSINAKTSVR